MCVICTQLPVPAELTVKPSCIPDAGLGVFANRMGPYEVDMGDLSTTDYTCEVGFHGNMYRMFADPPLQWVCRFRGGGGG